MNLTKKISSKNGFLNLEDDEVTEDCEIENNYQGDLLLNEPMIGDYQL